MNEQLWAKQLLMTVRLRELRQEKTIKAPSQTLLDNINETQMSRLSWTRSEVIIIKATQLVQDREQLCHLLFVSQLADVDTSIEKVSTEDE